MTFDSQVIPNITSIEWTNSADEITTETADGTLKDPGSSSWSVTVQFVFPATGSHTLEGAIKDGAEGSITCDVGNTRYTHSAVKSLGYTKSGNPTSHIAGSLNLVMDTAPTMAAVP